ncbi:uncharacterized protein N7503_002332 [Penicillium pulvis]|uniref:uncharacterized protein n=1 Tax=Penicillium pulvis TaxID=1562058 RepID=UPI0025491BF3|nr:uncharacterized protein N7503_002332 [Penicillium pulvis]KAJ5810114.1 hypothetical protein N7503_002332 [Penicillium pulvis]
MDPFSLTVGTLGIVGAAVQSISALIHEINAIRDAPVVIAGLRDELVAVEAILLVLDNPHKNSQLEHLTPDARTALQLTVTHCAKACTEFRNKIVRWTKHSGEKLHAWDRVRVGLFAERTVETLCEQLNRYKSTMNIAVSTATLLATATSYPTVNAMQEDLYIKETEIAQEISKIDEQLAEARNTLQYVTQAQLLNDHQDGAEVIEQFQDQCAALDDSRKLLESLLAEARQVRAKQNITDVDMSDGGRLLVGLINFDNDNGDVRQEIHNVKATNHGKGVIGVAKGFDVNSFFQ